MPYIDMPFTVQLDNTLRVTPLSTLFAKGDSNAHRFELTVMRGGAQDDLTGCKVVCKFYRMAENTVVKITGSVEDGKAVAVLDKACYDYTGRFTLAISIKQGEANTTVFYGDGYMQGQSEDKAITGEYIVYDIDTLIEKLAEIDEATEAAKTATASANTATGKANTATTNAINSANNANKQAEAAKSAAEAANAAAKNWGNSTAANSEKLGGKAPEYYIQPTNLLVNSWFGDYVNQRGSSDYTGNGAYTIDMWYLGAQNTKAVVQYKSVKAVTTAGSAYASLCQKVQNIKKYAGKTLTFAAYVKSNVVPKINVYNGSDSIASKEGTSGSYQVLVCSFAVPSDVADNAISVRILSKSTQVDDYIEVQWAALYEGSYTADTLPPYVPKGYAAELTECQRYYYRIPTSGARMSYVGYTAGTNTVRITIPTPIPMRTTPSMVFPDGSVGLSVYTQSGTVGVSSAQVTHSQSCATAIEATTTSTVAEWVMCAARFTVSAALSAEP